MTAASIYSVDAQTFTRDVMDRSVEVPVLVVFLAPWSEHCTKLERELELLVGEFDGAFVLAKVDVDKNPELMQALKLESVPSALLLKDGRPLDGFAGALPEAELRAFLEPHVQSTPEIDPIGEARELLKLGEVDEARELLEALLEADEENAEVRSLLAQCEHAGKADQLPALELRVQEHPDDIAARLELGRALVATGRNEDGLEMLFEAALLDLHYEDDAPRKALVEAFGALGFGDPLSLEYQQRLSVLLCS